MSACDLRDIALNRARTSAAKMLHVSGLALGIITIVGLLMASA